MLVFSRSLDSLVAGVPWMLGRIDRLMNNGLKFGTDVLRVVTFGLTSLNRFKLNV